MPSALKGHCLLPCVPMHADCGVLLPGRRCAILIQQNCLLRMPNLVTCARLLWCVTTSGTGEILKKPIWLLSKMRNQKLSWPIHIFCLAYVFAARWLPLVNEAFALFCYCRGRWNICWWIMPRMHFTNSFSVPVLRFMNITAVLCIPKLL